MTLTFDFAGTALAVSRRDGEVVGLWLSRTSNDDTDIGPVAPLDSSFVTGDEISVYAFEISRGFMLVHQVIVAADSSDYTVEGVVLPTAPEDTPAYSFLAGALKTEKIPHLGRYQASAGQDYSSLLTVTANSSAAMRLFFTHGEDVYLTSPYSIDRRVNGLAINGTALSSTLSTPSYTRIWGSLSAKTVTCDGATSILAITMAAISGILPAAITFTWALGLLTFTIANWESNPVVTFLRDKVISEVSATSASTQETFPVGYAAVLSDTENPVTFVGVENITTIPGVCLSYTLQGFLGDVVSYSTPTTSGEVILTDPSNTVDLRVGDPVKLTVLAASGVLRSATAGVISECADADGRYSRLIVIGVPGTSVSVSCVEDGIAHSKTVTIGVVDSVLDWRADPWWDAEGGGDEGGIPMPGEFTPEARLEKLHCVNYGVKGDIALRVRKAGLIPTFEEIQVPNGVHDYLFDRETYGYTMPFAPTKFHAEVTLPGAKPSIIEEVWPQASTQWTVVYGTPDPVGEGGSELGYIVVTNPTVAPVTLSVRSDLILSNFDVIGVVPAQTTMSFPILQSYLSWVAAGVLRCRVVGKNGALERDYAYTEASHIIHISYPSDVIQTGTYDWMALAKYGAIALVAGGVVILVLKVVDAFKGD